MAGVWAAGPGRSSGRGVPTGRCHGARGGTGGPVRRGGDSQKLQVLIRLEVLYYAAVAVGGRVVRFVAESPAHVCVNEIVVTPTWNRLILGGGEMLLAPKIE